MGNNEISNTEKFSKLRQDAEALLEKKKNKVTGTTLSREEVLELIHELSTHQIELELQNEELRRAQVEIISLQQKYLDLFEHAPVGYLIVGTNGLISEANLTASEILGITRDSLIKKPISRIIFSEDQDVFYRCKRNLLETKMGQEAEIRLLKFDGSQFHGHLRLSVNNFDGAQDVEEIKLIITDITERVLAREAVGRYEEKLEGAVQDRTEKMQVVINAMSGRENRMIELKEVIEKLRQQIIGNGKTPVTDDPLRLKDPE